MRKKRFGNKIAVTIVLIILSIVLVSCTKSNEEKVYKEYSQLEGETLAVASGTVFDAIASSFIPNVDFLYATNFSEQLAALKEKRAGAMLPIIL